MAHGVYMAPKSTNESGTQYSPEPTRGDFQYYFSCRLDVKFLVKTALKITRYLNCISTLH